MALDQNAKYPVGTAAATGDYPEGSAVNSTAPGALNGYPLEKDQLNDRFGLEQALLRSSGQAASGAPDTALVSQYLQGIIELASGRANNYDDSGVANAYVLDVQANQQAPASLFIGMTVNFIAAFPNTGASTVDPVGLGVKSIKLATGGDPVAGSITGRTQLIYDGVNFLLSPLVTGGDAHDHDGGDGAVIPAGGLAPGQFGGDYVLLQDQKALGVGGGTSLALAWQTRNLTTEASDSGSVCTLAANQFTLLAGTYRIYASAPAYRAATHRIRLKNVTDTTYPLYGQTAYSYATAPSQTHSFLVGEFTIATAKTFTLEHWTAGALASDGLGFGSGFGDGVEIYSQVELWRVK